MNIKYQIFISSTYEDLKEERDQVIKACLEMGHIPVGMEMFSAADEEQWQIIARQIEASDYYVVIVANKYGSMVEGISYTEKEYDYAISKGVPVLGFVLDDDAMWPIDRSESTSKVRTKLETFKKKVRGKPVSFWKNKEQLYGRVSQALGKAFNTRPRPGWISVAEIGGSEVSAEMSRLSSENARLRAEVEKLQKSNDTSGLAQGDDTYVLNLYLQDTSRKVSLRTTWNELFIVAAKSVKVDPTVRSIKYDIPHFFTKRANQLYQAEHPGEPERRWPVAFAPPQQFEEIEAQFIALGFIQTGHRSAAEDSAIWKLTPAGEKQYGLSLAKRRDD